MSRERITSIEQPVPSFTEVRTSQMIKALQLETEEQSAVGARLRRAVVNSENGRISAEGRRLTTQLYEQGLFHEADGSVIIGSKERRKILKNIMTPSKEELRKMSKEERQALRQEVNKSVAAMNKSVGGLNQWDHEFQYVLNGGVIPEDVIAKTPAAVAKPVDVIQEEPLVSDFKSVKHRGLDERTVNAREEMDQDVSSTEKIHHQGLGARIREGAKKAVSKAVGVAALVAVMGLSLAARDGKTPIIQSEGSNSLQTSTQVVKKRKRGEVDSLLQITDVPIDFNGATIKVDTEDEAGGKALHLNGADHSENIVEEKAQPVDKNTQDILNKWNLVDAKETDTQWTLESATESQLSNFQIEPIRNEEAELDEKHGLARVLGEIKFELKRPRNAALALLAIGLMSLTVWSYTGLNTNTVQEVPQSKPPIEEAAIDYCAVPGVIAGLQRVYGCEPADMLPSTPIPSTIKPVMSPEVNSESPTVAQDLPPVQPITDTVAPVQEENASVVSQVEGDVEAPVTMAEISYGAKPYTVTMEAKQLKNLEPLASQNISQETINKNRTKTWRELVQGMFRLPKSHEVRNIVDNALHRVVPRSPAQPSVEQARYDEAMREPAKKDESGLYAREETFLIANRTLNFPVRDGEAHAVKIEVGEKLTFIGSSKGTDWDDTWICVMNQQGQVGWVPANSVFSPADPNMKEIVLSVPIAESEYGE